MTVSILHDLVEGAIEDARERERQIPLREVERRAESLPPARDVMAALAPADTIRVIAEIKRASPSRGHIADIPDPAAHARVYEEGGASAISVLTEGRRFRGSLDDLSVVHEAVSLPVIRKDFIVTEYQVAEARAHGADFLLLIVAALDPIRLSHLRTLAASMGMAALVEAHNPDEVRIAVDSGAGLIGINARDLRDFHLDTDLFGTMADLIPAGVIRVAESAVRERADVEKYADAGADVALVGETLVRGDARRLLADFTSVRTRTPVRMHDK